MREAFSTLSARITELRTMRIEWLGTWVSFCGLYIVLVLHVCFPPPGNLFVRGTVYRSTAAAAARVVRACILSRVAVAQ